MAEINSSPPAKKNTGVKKLFPRSTRVDLTPMVDLGFLLVTFFVFTSTMKQPTALDMRYPNDRDGSSTNAPASGALTVYVLSKNQYAWLQGLEKIPQQGTILDLRRQITAKKKSVPADKLMIIFKATDEATYEDVIRLHNEMLVCDIPPGHYAESEPDDADKKMIAAMDRSNN